MEKESMSETRKIYFLRLAGRCVLFLIVLAVYFLDKEDFKIAEGTNFIKRFSLLHILWGIWIWDMFLQLIPVKAHISIGSRKVFSSLFRPIKERVNRERLRQYIKCTTAAAYKVMVIWLMVPVQTDNEK